MRLLLIEDDRKIASFILKGMKSAGFAVDHAADGLTGYDMAVSEPYDAAIIDVMLPGLSGLAIVEKLRERGVKVTVSTDDPPFFRGLQAGSDDYLTKPFAFSELLARVQALLRRATGASEPTRLKAGDLVMDLITRRVERAGQLIELQPLEFSLLEYLMRNQGRVVSKTMIMEHVWDYYFDPQTNVVESRIYKLREKIDKGFASKMIQTVRGVGYVLKEDQ